MSFQVSLTAGTRIGSYEIRSPLGEGVVYRATNTQLQRDVALKQLPDYFVDDPDRLLRFQREAQVLASLNHPNIAQIYGIEESSNRRCIVMELVDGETLAEHVNVEHFRSMTHYALRNRSPRPWRRRTSVPSFIAI